MKSQLVPLLAAAAVCTKIIIDNDWTSTGYITFLLALDAGWDVLGLVGDTANTWALQSSLHALALLEIGNLSVPVHKGVDYPLLNSPELFDAWQMVHGSLSFQGVFAPYNATAEELGQDPTSGDPSRISKAAFVQGYPNTTLSGNMAAAWMVEQVRKYPGEVTIYSGGALTNVALAIRLDSKFASLTRGLAIMGGYIDVTLLEAGSKHMADLNSDVNLKVDPEAAKIALTADFPSITVTGNGANQVFPDEAFQDEVYEVVNPYTTLFKNHYGTKFPFWDETGMFAALYPEQVNNVTQFFVDVDTAHFSPYYGNVRAYSEARKPTAQTLRHINYVNEVNATALKNAMKRSMQYPNGTSLV